MPPPEGPLRRFFRAFPHDRSLRPLVRRLTAVQLVPLALAIASLFTVLGIITDVMKGGRQLWPVVVANCLLAGLVSLGYAFGLLFRRYWLLALAVAVQAMWLWADATVVDRLPLLPASAAQQRLRTDGVVTLILVIVSYAAFLRFINGTAARYLRASAEIELARQIHAVLVPRVDLRTPDFEFSGFSFASGDVGGDLVDVVSSEDGWFGYVADVSGHGVSSGVVMGMFKSALRMRLRQPGTIAELLDDLNEVLVPLKSGSMYVTAACVRSNGGSMLDFAVAGHLPILRVRRGSGVVDRITTQQIPLGLFEDYSFAASTLESHPGDLLVLITDGLTEVVDHQDQELGIDGIERVLVDLADRPLDEIGRQLLEASRAHGVQFDDQTLLLIRRL
jgi:serine phosphatase RsbU (regulator of sigma subunit)